MKSRKPSGSFAPHEVQRFILPITVTFIAIMIGLIVIDLVAGSYFKISLLVYGFILIIGTLINNAAIVRTPDFRVSYGWSNAILSGVSLGLLPYFLPDDLSDVSHVLTPLALLAITIVSGRLYGYVAFLFILALDLPHLFDVLGEVEELVEFGVPYIVSLVAMEAILRIKDTTRQHIFRLETINRVSRQIMLSLETEKTLTLLNNTMPEALEADTYFVGILRGG